MKKTFVLIGLSLLPFQASANADLTCEKMFAAVTTNAPKTFGLGPVTVRLNSAVAAEPQKVQAHVAAAPAPVEPAPAAPALAPAVIAPAVGGVSMDFVKRMTERRIDPTQETLAASAQRNGLDNLLAPRAVLRDHNDTYTTVLNIGQIKSQGQSGRCWDFAGQSMIETDLISSGRVPQDTKFSRSHTYFFYLLEHSDAHLGRVLGLRENSSRIKSDTLVKQLTPTFGDGAYFQDYQYIVSKYGLVPENAMPETANSQDSARVQKEIHDYLQVKSMELWDLAQSFSNSPSAYAQFMAERAGQAPSHGSIALEKLTPEQLQLLQKKREETLSGVWKILETALGRPPTEFTMKVTDMSTLASANPKAELRKFTPLGFSKDFLGFNPHDFVEIVNFPNRPLSQKFVVKYPDVVAERQVLTATPRRMWELTATMIRHGLAVWYASDVDNSISVRSGVASVAEDMNQNVYGMTVKERAKKLSVSIRSFLGKISGNHAQVFMAIDEPKGVSEPIKIGSENSWGPGVGTGGIMHVYRSWFDVNVESIIIARAALTPEEQKIWDSRGTRLRIGENPH